LEAVSEKSANVLSLTQDMTESMEKQSQFIIAINDTVKRISSNVQSNAAQSEESAAVSEEATSLSEQMSSQAEALNDIIKKFKVKK
jgi:methyl-accepting chemotaxis protein